MYRASEQNANLFAPSALPGDPGLPLYHRLAQLFQNAVARQQWRPGERLPSDNELAERLGVAVGTVRAALSDLVRKGVLERQQGRGTFICRPSFDSSLLRFWRFQERDGIRIPGSRILRLAKTKPSAEARDQLQLDKKDDAVFLSRLRLRDEKPVVAEEIWLPYRRFSPLLKTPAGQLGPLLYPEYEKICGEYVARAEEQLTARSAPQKYAQLLNIKAGNPLIVICRLARGFDDSPLEWRISRGCAKLFQYHIDIR